MVNSSAIATGILGVVGTVIMDAVITAQNFTGVLGSIAPYVPVGFLVGTLYVAFKMGK